MNSYKMTADQKKQSMAIVISLVVILGLVAYAGTIFFKEKTPTPDAIPQTSAVIEIDFNNGKKRAFEGELDGGVYSLDLALQSAAEEGKFAVSIKQGAIEHIAGVDGPWKIYQNGAVLQNPPESLTITGGDYYVLKRE